MGLCSGQWQRGQCGQKWKCDSQLGQEVPWDQTVLGQLESLEAIYEDFGSHLKLVSFEEEGYVVYVSQ